MSSLNNSLSLISFTHLLIPEVRTEILKIEINELLNDNCNFSITIGALITYQDESNVPILEDENLSETSYSKLISLALSVLANVPSDDKFRLGEEFRRGEEEEAKRLEIAAKILPELINYRPKDRERINRLSNIFKALNKVISKERNKEVKEALEENMSFPSEIREALGLKAISVR